MFILVGIDVLILLCTDSILLSLRPRGSTSDRLHFDLQDLLIGLRRAVAAVNRIAKAEGRSGTRVVVAGLFGQGELWPTLLDLVALLQMAYELNNAFFRLFSGLLPFVPVRNLASEVNSLDLLDESSNDVILFVAKWPHRNQV